MRAACTASGSRPLSSDGRDQWPARATFGMQEAAVEASVVRNGDVPTQHLAELRGGICANAGELATSASLMPCTARDCSGDGHARVHEPVLEQRQLAAREARDTDLENAVVRVRQARGLEVDHGEARSVQRAMARTPSTGRRRWSARAKGDPQCRVVAAVGKQPQTSSEPRMIEGRRSCGSSRHKTFHAGAPAQRPRRDFRLRAARLSRLTTAGRRRGASVDRVVKASRAGGAARADGPPAPSHRREHGDTGGYRGRRPSPTGGVHLGIARTSLVAFLARVARKAGWSCASRTSTPRVVPGSTERINRRARRLGLDWDEGPDLGHAGRTCSPRATRTTKPRCRARRRRARVSLHLLAQRNRAGRERAARRTRPDVSGHVRSGESHPGRPASLRFRMPDARESFVDVLHGPYAQEYGRLRARRSDGVYAYQLVVVVDDIEMRSARSCAGTTCSRRRRVSSRCTARSARTRPSARAAAARRLGHPHEQARPQRERQQSARRAYRSERSACSVTASGCATTATAWTSCSPASSCRLPRPGGTRELDATPQPSAQVARVIASARDPV